MTWGLVAVAGATVVGAYGANKAAKTQAQASREASAAQAESAQESIESQERMFDRQVELQEPFRRVGVNALPELVEASKYKPFTYEDFVVDPGYRFRLREGLKALEASKAAGGMLRSGNTLRGITQFGQGLASDEYSNAFNRYNIGFQNRLNPLQALAGVGQTSSNTLTGAAGNLGAGMASTYGNLGNALAANAINAGNARASGYAGMANAFSSGIGQGLNYYQGQQAQKQQQQNFNDYMNYLKG